MKTEVVDRIIGLLRGAQGEYFGEPVTQLEHALQCAQLARSSDADDETVIAALLHDIGHLVAPGDETGSVEHDRIGADYLLQLGFSAGVAELVAGHVQAKRYLTAVDSHYYSQLSDASKRTLQQQGGSMSPAEAKAFEQDPMFQAKLTLRHWDEQAKVANLVGDGPGSYRELLERRLRE